MASAAAIPQDIYPGQDFYVPGFKVLVRGKELIDVRYDMIGVTYTDNLNEMDSCDLTVNNWDPNGKSGNSSGSGQGWFKYSDSDVFDPWQDVQLWMGYYRNGYEDMRRLLSGEITRMTPNFTGSGASTLTVHCINLLHRFRTQQISKDYIQKKDSEIARDLVQDIAKETRQKIPGLDIQIDSDQIDTNLANEKAIQHLTIKQEFAINYLFRRSREIGYEISIEESGSDKRIIKLHWGPSSEVIRPTYILEWGKSLISFAPSFGTARQVNAVIVRAWDPKRKQKFEAKVTRADLLKEGVLDPTEDMKVKQGPLADRTEIINDFTVQSDDEAKLMAKKRLRLIAQGLVEGKGKTVGLPDLRAGTKVKIVGLGRYDGMYVVTTTTHSMGDGGYTTDFSARMEK
jgi:Phage protein D